MVDKTNRSVRPDALTVLPDNIPAFVKAIPQWVGWRWEWKDNKWTKPPINLKNGDQHAKSNDASTWVTFDTAIKVYQNKARGFHLDGIGLAIKPENELVGVDWDGVFDPDTGEVKYDADTDARILDTYVEWSPTHTGYRAFLKASLPGTERRSDKIEMYNSGRYMTVTGHRLEYAAAEVNERQEQIEAFHGHVFKDRILRRSQPVKSKRRGSTELLILSDNEVVERIRRSKTGGRFEQLFFQGAGDENHSSVDLALCNTLAFWCQKDEVQIDRIFRQSALYREKWERPDYRTWTIELALRDCNQVYTPKRTRQPAERNGNGHKQSSMDSGYVTVKAEGEPVSEDTEIPLLPDIPVMQRNPEIYEGLPEIEVGDRQLRHITTDAMDALLLANEPAEIFINLAALARLQKDDSGKIRPVMLTLDMITSIMARRANWIKDAFKDVPPPPVVMRDMLALGNWPGIPVLKNIVTSPVLSPSFSIIDKPGFDRESGIYFDDLGTEIPSQELTPESYEAARTLIIDDMLGDFPFIDDASRANTVALMLSPIIRPAIAGPVPMTVIDAPAAGTGKSLLADIILLLYSPAGPPTRSCPPQDDDAEWKKSITAAMIAKSQFFYLDNVKGAIYNASLLSAITSTTWTDRVLGSKDQIDMQHSMIFVATANNISMDNELSRRIVWVRMDANDEHPEQRTGFKHEDIKAWVLENRTRILSALILITRAWLENGRKPCSKKIKPLGSFEAYTKVMSAVMDYATPGFLDNRETQNKKTSETGPWHGFVEEWFQDHKTRPVTSNDLLSLAQKYLLDHIGDKGEQSQKNRLAKLLTRNTDRVFAGKKIMSIEAGDTDFAYAKVKTFRLHETK